MDLRTPKLSDGLEAMIRAFEPTRTTGMVMTRKNVSILIDGLHVLLDEARHLETIADKAQWNERARTDAMRARRAELAAAVENGDVTLLPVAPRARAVHREEGGAA